MPSYIDRENYCENICHCNHLRCDKKQCSIWKAPEVEMVVKVEEEGKDNG